MNQKKLTAGAAFPNITATLSTGEDVQLGTPRQGYSWQAVFVYRGKHCPKCTNYLNELEHHLGALAEIGIDVIAVSADSREQLDAHLEKLSISYPIAYGLSLDDAKKLGLYLSLPRSENETDHNFTEPGLFIVNEQGNLHIVDISNSPFTRPDLSVLVGGLAFIRDPNNNYPIRGTIEY